MKCGLGGGPALQNSKEKSRTDDLMEKLHGHVLTFTDRLSSGVGGVAPLSRCGAEGRLIPGCTDRR